jgi:hypothetical protein
MLRSTRETHRAPRAPSLFENSIVNFRGAQQTPMRYRAPTLRLAPPSTGRLQPNENTRAIPKTPGVLRHPATEFTLFYSLIGDRRVAKLDQFGNKKSLCKRV